MAEAVQKVLARCEQQIDTFAKTAGKILENLIQMMAEKREQAQKLRKNYEQATQDISSLPKPSEVDRTRQHEERPDNVLPIDTRLKR